VTRPEAREKFETFWGVEKLPDKNGLMIHQMMEGLVTGKIRFSIFLEKISLIRNRIFEKSSMYFP
jgi:formate dehydrogenase major subunit